jgi:hypothetical protein
MRTTGREPAVEARALAYLYVAGASLAAISLALPHAATQDDLGIAATIALACLGALVLLLGASRIPGWGVQVSLALGTLLGDQPLDLVVLAGMKRLEPKVLELPLDGVDP